MTRFVGARKALLAIKIAVLSIAGFVRVTRTGDVRVTRTGDRRVLR